MNTIVKVIITKYKDDSIASFGFMGAPTKFEMSKKNQANINDDETVKETKRYNIYSSFVKRYFNPTEFEHISFPDSSCYLLKSVDNKDLTTDKIELFFNDYINIYC